MSFSILIVDDEHDVPRMDGLELLREMRRLRPDLRVLMVTAYGDDERKRRADKLGAFLSKPVDFDELKQQLLQPMHPTS